MAQRGPGAAAGSQPAARAGARPAEARRRDARPDPSYRDSRPGPDLGATRARLRAIIEPAVAAAGLDLEELTVTRAGRRLVVRVSVDGDTGVGHDELSALSRDLSSQLDEAEQTGGELSSDSYTLEVSSPGIDRPLTTLRHWRRNVGRLVKVKAGNRAVTARVLSVDEVGVSLDAGGDTLAVAFGDLGPGRVQVEFAKLAELADEDLGDEFDDNHTGNDDTGNDDDGDGEDDVADGDGPRRQEDGA